MRKSIGRFFLIFALVMSVVAVQNVFAETFDVSGVITGISDQPNMITLDNGTDIYGVKYNYLENQYNIVLDIGETVSFLVYEFTCKDGSTKLMATAITIGDATITLR